MIVYIKDWTSAVGRTLSSYINELKEGECFMTKRSTRTIILAMTFCLLLAGAFLTGCNSSKAQVDKPSDTATTPPPSNTDTIEQPKNSQQIKLYFPNSDATGLVSFERTVEVKDQAVIKAMFSELANPPSGYEPPLPSGTTLLDATVSADGIATINLSKEFKANFGGGSTEEQMTIYSIVNTLTTLPNIRSVQFLLEGAKHAGILGHLDTHDPIKRDESLIIKS
ncbi:Sporulation and spore germination [Desulfosporosinus hippei DSM 8344]|uniref:Sporulation and spore germination n=2 Tax=Desulfosporosinus TaxID=79206 RepID=A0A1G7S5D1_9FIRM|nr:Sporulation and spore germination [Desulfosporosinus hippei DSM 8344]